MTSMFVTDSLSVSSLNIFSPTVARKARVDPEKLEMIPMRNWRRARKLFLIFHVLLSFLTPLQHSVALIINFKCERKRKIKNYHRRVKAEEEFISLYSGEKVFSSRARNDSSQRRL